MNTFELSSRERYEEAATLYVVRRSRLQALISLDADPHVIREARQDEFEARTRFQELGFGRPDPREAGERCFCDVDTDE